MSRSGLLLECLERVSGMADSDAVEIEIELPAVHTVRARCIYSTGRIVRIEQAGERIALALVTMTVRDAEAAMGDTRGLFGSRLM